MISETIILLIIIISETTTIITIIIIIIITKTIKMTDEDKCKKKRITASVTGKTIVNVSPALVIFMLIFIT